VVVADLSPAVDVVTPERRARWLLALGAATGLAVAAGSIVTGTRRDVLPPDAVATVNDVAIRREDYLLALGAVAGDRRAPLDDADERRVLDRLIDEELLLQRGLALGIARRDRTVRAQLVAATMDLLASTTSEPSREELRAFYDGHTDYFTEPGRVRVRQVLVRTTTRSEADARARAEDAARRLRAGEPFDAVRTALGDEETAPIPDALLPAAKLRDYVGETAMTAALERDAGETTDPVRSSMGFHVLQVVERTAPFVPPFDDVVDRVRGERRRRADEATLRAALDELRRAARVRVAEPPP
jgi:parvulin-like peptidyl-prolyl isomerase